MSSLSALDGINTPLDLQAELSPVQKLTDVIGEQQAAHPELAQPKTELVLGAGFNRFRVTGTEVVGDITTTYVERGLGSYAIMHGPDTLPQIFQHSRHANERGSGWVRLPDEQAEKLARASLAAVRRGVRTRTTRLAR